MRVPSPQEVVAIERFYHHIVSAGSVRVFVIVGRRVASGGDHRHVRDGRLDQTDEKEAVFPGVAQVGDDQVERVLLDQPGGVVAVLRNGDLEQTSLF